MKGKSRIVPSPQTHTGFSFRGLVVTHQVEILAPHPVLKALSFSLMFCIFRSCFQPKYVIRNFTGDLHW
jgi:hypothetical protein